MHKIKKVFSAFPLFVLLLPILFVLHGYIEHYDLVSTKEALSLTLFYIAIALIILLVATLVYGNLIKGAFFAGFLLSFQFFFGAFHDRLRQLFPGAFLARYSFLLPASAILMILVFIVIRRQKSFANTLLYLNVLFIVLILVDLGLFMPKYSSIQKQNRQFIYDPHVSVCDSCTRPDIYLIVADEYAGDSELSSLFNFDNSPFLDSLTKKGFHVFPKSHSNYIATQTSMASFFAMNYLSSAEDDPDPGSHPAYFQNNFTLSFLKKHGYSIVNNSIFDFDGMTQVHLDFLPRQAYLITSQTFTNRVWRDLGFNLATKFKIPYLSDKYLYSIQKITNKTLEKTRKEATLPPGNPRFIYTHLLMPHFPFYFHKDGSPFSPGTLREDEQWKKENYLDYLQYSNKVYLALIDSVLANSKKPPVILFLSDHGYRHFIESSRAEGKLKFANLMSMYLPGRNYDGLPDSLSNVNYLRSFFNRQFNQRFDMLPDSIFLNQNDPKTKKLFLKAEKY